MPIRSNASRNGPIGLCQAESFRNSFADSVSFRFPSWQSLDGHPVPPANYASGRATPASKSSANKKRKATGRLQACRLNASPRSAGCSVVIALALIKNPDPFYSHAVSVKAGQNPFPFVNAKPPKLSRQSERGVFPL